MQARGIEAVPGSRIEYVVTSGKEKIRDRIKLADEVKEGEYDPDYYLNNQVLPAIEKIIEVLGVNIQEIIDGKKQSRLGDYF
jgi:DNA polymerase I